MQLHGADARYWVRWTLNCALGELAGIGVAGAIAFGVNDWIGEPQSLPMKLLVLASMLVAGAIEGTLLGILQWRVLVQKIPSITLREWWMYTVLVAVLGWFLGMLPSLFLFPGDAPASGPQPPDLSHPVLFALLSVGAGLALGAVFGLFQWFSLRRHTRRAGTWILANALGWGFGLGWIYLFASLPGEDTTMAFNIAMGVAGGLLAGLSVGAVTGFFLLRIARDPDGL